MYRTNRQEHGEMVFITQVCPPKDLKPSTRLTQLN